MCGPNFFEEIHLSTGTRTGFVHEVINFIVKHQQKEAMFMDAVEFFSDTLKNLIEVEKQNVERGD